MNKSILFRITSCMIAALSFMGCMDDKKGAEVVERFPLEFDLKPVGVDSLNNYPGTYDISVAGDYFVGMRKADYFFFVLDKDFRLVDEIAPKGHGDGEFMAPLYCGQYIEEDSLGFIYVLERPARKLYKVALDGKTPRKCVLELPLSWELEPAYMFKCGQDSCIGGNSLYDTDFFVIDLSDDKVEKFEPVFAFDGSMAEVADISQNIATYSSSRSRMAVAYFNLPEMDIRTSSGEIIKSVFYKDLMKPEEIDRYEPKEYFLGITSTPRHIYALYVGDDMERKNGKSLVLVFDWDGNPVCRMRIDASMSIAVDEQNGRIISINEDDSQYVGVEYGLPEELL